MDYLYAFLTGGVICGLSQILIDRTKLTPARILTSYVVAGVILTAAGAYDKIVEFGGAGATVPLLGFGYAMAKGVQEGVQSSGIIGAFTGGLTATAGGIAGVVLFSLVAAALFTSGDRS